MPPRVRRTACGPACAAACPATAAAAPACEACGLILGAQPGPALAPGVGFGRTVAPETEVSNMLANLV